MAVLCAFGATSLWGVAFVAPGLVATDGAELAIGRYIVFGLSSLLLLALRGFDDLRGMTRRDWWRIIALGLLGNSLFYGLMSAGIVAVGAVPVALVFACLPLVMAAVGNYRRPAFAWRSVAGPFLLVAAGLTVNTVTSVAGEIEGVGPYPVLGFTLAALALLSWLVYGVWNSEYLTDHPLTKSVAWTSQLGLGTLITLPLIFGLDTLMHGHPPIPPTIGLPTLLTWCVILGLGSTWVATWLWSRASLRLGAAVLGLLLVTEAMFAVLFACLVEWRLPTPAEASAGSLTLGGVAWGLFAITRGRRRRTAREATRLVLGGTDAAGPDADADASRTAEEPTDISSLSTSTAGAAHPVR
jgi:drug/metabolite transporter (DMT)-like permease